MVSVVIPARNEPYLQNTIDSLLTASEDEIEVIAVLDGYWPDPPIQDSPHVKQIHFSESKGMRTAINAGARVAQGKYLMKCDGHCLFDKGFDEKLKADCKPDWTVIPRRYGLDANTWTKTDKLSEFQYIRQADLKGKDWPDYADRVKGQQIVDLMTSQGSCWFMYRNHFWDLGGLDDINYGSMGKEAQEICLKTWLSDGRYVLNRNTWYAHWSKDTGLYKDVKQEKRKSAEFALRFWIDGHGYKYPLLWLINKFAPVPTWDGMGGNGDEISKKEDAEIKENEKFYTKNFEQIGVERNSERDGREEIGRKGESTEDSEQIIKKRIPERSIRVVKKLGMNRAGLYRYFASLGFKVGAEIGVQRARNAWVMLENIPGLKLYLIDPYKDNNDTQRQWGERAHAKARRIAHRRLVGRNVKFIEEFSLGASQRIQDGSLDFVHIDGEHSYDYVMMDNQLWSRKVRRGGIVSGHDYHLVKSNKFKVEDAVNDFVTAHNITLYITDERAKELPGDSYASWFWIKG